MKYENFDVSKERVLITGGCGFVGHHLGPALKEGQAEVLIADNLGHNNLTYFWSDQPRLPTFKKEVYLKFLSSRLEIIHQAGCKFENVDSRNFSQLEELFKKFNPTKVIHLAAIASAKASDETPDVAYDNSLNTLENALECTRLRPREISQFIYLSSSMVYGDFPPEGASEDNPLKPKGIYGSLKLAAEHLLIAYNQTYGIPYTIVRPSALYGPRCVSRRVTSVFIENLLEGIPLHVEGDGEEKLDFTYIKDLVQGLLRIIIRPEGKNEIFNITYGQHRSIKDLIEILKKYFPDIKVVNLERDQSKPHRGTLKIDKARKLLDYKPAYPLERGLPEYIEWYKEALK